MSGSFASDSIFSVSPMSLSFFPIMSMDALSASFSVGSPSPRASLPTMPCAVRNGNPVALTMVSAISVAVVNPMALLRAISSLLIFSVLTAPAMILSEPLQISSERISCGVTSWRSLL